MRDSVPTPIAGPYLLFEHRKEGQESFFCASCHTDFHTADPVSAFQLFSQHVQKCPGIIESFQAAGEHNPP